MIRFDGDKHVPKPFLVLILPAIFLLPAQATESGCTLTPERSLGNSYKANVAKLNTRPGEGLIIEGRVLSINDCVPIEDAVIEIWSAGDDGKYDDRLRVYTMTLPDGSYRFETEWPNMPVSHVHFIVSAGGYKRLTTQWIPDERVNTATFDLVLEPALRF